MSFSHFIATGFYIGRIPRAPGTFGTLLGVPAAWFASGLGLPAQAAFVLAVIAVSIFVCGRATARIGTEDHPSIVADEVSGYLVSFFFIPFTLANATLVFILFRFFDILKPYPVSLLDERVKGGAGIVLDDLAAGVYANISAQIILWLAPW